MHFAVLDFQRQNSNYNGFPSGDNRQFKADAKEVSFVSNLLQTHFFYVSYESDPVLFNFDYKEDLMRLAVERQRVFRLKTLEQEKMEAVEYMKLNPIVKYTPKILKQ